MRFHITLIQQQGYQHAGFVNLCLVRYNLWRFDTAVRTYNCSPCSKCFILFCQMATAIEWNSLFLRSYMQYSTELQKLMVTFNQSNEMLFVRLCYSKLQSHLVPQASALPHREGRAWSTVYTTAVQPLLWILWPNLRTVFSHVIRCCPQHPFND